MLCKTRGTMADGDTVTVRDRDGIDRTQLTLVTRLDDGSWVMHPQMEGTPEEILLKIGRVPLPNYIRGGDMVDSDFTDYQTLFAKHAGAVAAPTAGLHLTKRLTDRLVNRDVTFAEVTLHVGIGTFRPVKVDDLSDHEMHYEWGEISQATVDKISACRATGGRVIAVGTTSVRVLETAGADGTLKPWSGETNLVYQTAVHVQTDRRDDDQLSPAAQHVTGHDPHVRRRRAHDPRVLRSRRRKISLLQLWRHDADRVSAVIDGVS